MNRHLVLLSALALFLLSFNSVSLWAGQSQVSGNVVVQPAPDLSGTVLKPLPAPPAVPPVKGTSGVISPPSPRPPTHAPLNPLPAVPRTMSYQGKLTNASGQPVPDGNYQLILNLYTVPSGGSSIWTETDTVTTKAGLFNVPMGAKVSLNLSFAQDYYLGVAAAGDPEMAPRTKLTSAGYAFRADSSAYSANAAFADSATGSGRVGGHASGWSGNSIVPYTDGVTGLLNPAVIPAGGSGGPYVHLAGDSMTGTLQVGATGTSAAATSGVNGYASNTSTGTAYGGYFSTSSSGTGMIHYGVWASASGTSIGGGSCGVYGNADITSSGTAYGGYFSTTSGASTNPTYGVYGDAGNTSSGPVYGGKFEASTSGSGTHYGVWAQAPVSLGPAVYAAGNLVASGSKSAVVRTTQGEKLVYCTESPEIWFEDVGEGRLVNGHGHVDLDALYLETVTINASHPMRVFVQLTSGDPVQVVVTKGTRSFDVSASGPVSATFDYRVLAKRKGYENERLTATTVGQDDPTLYPERRAEIEAKMAKMREASNPGGVK